MAIGAKSSYIGRREMDNNPSKVPRYSPREGGNCPLLSSSPPRWRSRLMQETTNYAEPMPPDMLKAEEACH
jgi:hypothetical protein